MGGGGICIGGWITSGARGEKGRGGWRRSSCSLPDAGHANCSRRISRRKKREPPWPGAGYQRADRRGFATPGAGNQGRRRSRAPPGLAEKIGIAGEQGR